MVSNAVDGDVYVFNSALYMLLHWALEIPKVAKTSHDVMDIVRPDESI